MSKPFGSGQLLALVARWLPAGRAQDGQGDEGPLVDAAVLSRLAAELDAEILPELLDAFLGEAAGRAADMVGIAAAGDLRGLDRQAHSLRSSAGTFGAARLAARARGIEGACRAGDQAAALALARSLPALALDTAEAIAARERPST
jgi:HPt (histidine-containing phosphotransfer) domain-containing protein